MVRVEMKFRLGSSNFILYFIMPQVCWARDDLYGMCISMSGPEPKIK